VSYTFQLDPWARVSRPMSDGDGGYAIEFALGFDPEEDLIILMAVMLSRTQLSNTLEFHFGIRTRTTDGAISPPDYSKQIVDKYIPRDNRSQVKEYIGLCAWHLVLVASPRYIIMETFYPNLEQKALQKYLPIVERIEELGYAVTDQFRDETSGVNYWFFSRRGLLGWLLNLIGLVRGARR
jgi:hypothetical protein